MLINSLCEITDIDSSHIVTLNNEYLYLISRGELPIKSLEKIYWTCDSQYIRLFLTIIGNRPNLITGKVLFNYFQTTADRVLVCGKDLGDATKSFSNVQFHEVPFGTADEIAEKLLVDLHPRQGDIICIMLGAKKQEDVIAILRSHWAHIKGLVFAGLGGTWEQVCDLKTVPNIYERLGCSWIYRTLIHWDSTKPKKISRSLAAFLFYPKLIKGCK